MSTEHPRLPWPTRPEDYVVAEPVQGPISQREQGYQAGYAEAFPEREQLLAERAEARAERDDMDAYAQRLRRAVLELQAERDSLAAQLAEAWEEIKLQRTLRSAVLAERAALAAQLERARPVLEAAKACVAYVLKVTNGRRDSLWITAQTQTLIAAWDDYQSSPSELAAGHTYLSTACLHATEPGREHLHRECQIDTRRYDGSHKIGATCKWCDSRCVCACHTAPSTSEPTP